MVKKIESSRKFPEIIIKNFPPVQTFQITVDLLTSSLSIGFYRLLVSSSALIVTLKHHFRD